MEPRFVSPRAFRERVVPEGAELAGYAALVHAFEVDAPLRWGACVRLGFSSSAREVTRDWVLFEKRYLPEPSIAGHLTFALRHEDLDVLVLKRVFDAIGTGPLSAVVAEAPNGIWIRRAWFLFEWLTGGRLDVPDLTSGNYVDAIDGRRYFTSRGVNSSRHRVRDNLLGVPDFCPTVRRTGLLADLVARGLEADAREVVGRVDRRVLARAASFMLLADSQASFRIEGERAPRNRIERWGRAVMQAGERALSVAELERLQTVIIEGARLVRPGLRSDAVFLGDRMSDGTPVPEFIGARPTDLGRLMAGMLAANARMSEGLVPAVIQAAAISFGFVMIHPFEDGNGRIHRFLIHHVLAERGFSPPGVLFPVSSVILDRIEVYGRLLRAHSGPLMDHIEWAPTPQLNVAVSNDTFDLYALFDVTDLAVFLYDCVVRTVEEDLPREIAQLEAYDRAKDEIVGRFDMPDATVSLLITWVRQNGGKLSAKRRGGEFGSLGDDEVGWLEGVVARAYEGGI